MGQSAIYKMANLQTKTLVKIADSLFIDGSGICNYTGVK